MKGKRDILAALIFLTTGFLFHLARAEMLAPAIVDDLIDCTPVEAVVIQNPTPPTGVGIHFKSSGSLDS